MESVSGALRLQVPQQLGEGMVMNKDKIQLGEDGRCLARGCVLCWVVVSSALLLPAASGGHLVKSFTHLMQRDQ